MTPLVDAAADGLAGTSPSGSDIVEISSASHPARSSPRHAEDGRLRKGHAAVVAAVETATGAQIRGKAPPLV
jgi:hypothetical protein